MSSSPENPLAHQPVARSATNRQLLLMFLLLTGTLLSVGSFVFDRLRTNVERAVSENLAAIGSLKAGQIDDWIRERLDDAATLSGDAYFARTVGQWVRGGQRRDALRARIADRLQTDIASHHFRSIVIYDPRGKVLLEAGQSFEGATHMGEAALQAAASVKVEVIDLHRHADSKFPLGIGFVAPLLADGRVIGAIYFVEDPQRYLFPLLRQWPVASQTAESLLVRAEGGRVLFMNELRKHRNSPLSYSLPLHSPHLTAAIALRGQRGIIEHARDYAGTPVLSYAAAIEAMPWVLIAKIDEDEAFALVNKVETGALLVALLLFASSGAWFWQWHRRVQQAADADLLRERLRTDQIKIKSEKRFRAVFEHTALPMARIAPDGELLDANAAWCGLFGYSREEALGQRQNWSQLLHPDEVGQVGAQLARLLDGEAERCGSENRFCCRDGKTLWGNLQLSLVRDERGAPDYFICAVQDITERKHAEQTINFMAYHDKLTGLPNRALLFDRLAQAMSRAKRDGKYVALLFADLDGFKGVNDGHGHEAGDAVLKSAAQRFLACVRAADTVARFGGDEFAIILGNLDEPQQAAAVAEKVVRAFDQNIVLDEGGECRVGVSVGISIFPDNGSALDSLITAADHAMYQSKNTGKGQYTFYREEKGGNAAPWITFDDKHRVGVKQLDEQHRNLVYIVNRINDAIKNGDPTATILLMFDELLVATAHHFETESQLMREHRYPELAAHELEHAHLLNEAQNFKKQFTQGRELLALQSIKDWLLGHIAYSDKKMARYLSGDGVT